MKKILLLIALGVFVTSVFSQDEADTAWKIKGNVSLMFSQTSFTNWSSGGENNLNINSIFNLHTTYAKGNVKWENFLDLAYGQSKTGEQEYRKTSDKIDFQSIYGIKAAKKWFYTANLTFKSQFAEGYEYFDDDPNLDKAKISNFMSPGTLSFGLGMEYKPVDYISFYMSPITARYIFVLDQDLADAGAFGVEPAKYNSFDSTGMPVLTSKYEDGEKIRQEFGAYFRFMFVKEIMKNVNLNTKLELFSDYTREPGNIDVNWDTMIDLKVNEWINANFGLQLVYDHDTPILDNDGKVGPRTQLKQVLAVGLSYNFASK